MKNKRSLLGGLCLLFVLLTTSLLHQQQQTHAVQAKNQSTTTTYTADNGWIRANGNPVQFRGINANPENGDSLSAMQSWNFDMIRNPINDIRDFSVSALQQTADNSFSYGKVTVFAPFSWSDYNTDHFSGSDPSDESFYQAFLSRMTTLGQQLASRPYAWLETWNEPVDSNNPQKWVQEQRQIIDAIRQGGNDNPVLGSAPGWGLDDSTVAQYAAQVRQLVQQDIGRAPNIVVHTVEVVDGLTG